MSAELFSEVAEPHLATGAIEYGTIMGHPTFAPPETGSHDGERIGVGSADGDDRRGVRIRDECA